MKVSVKEAHALSCALKRHVDGLKQKNAYVSTQLQIAPGSQVDIKAWMASTLASIKEEAAQVKKLTGIYFWLRNAVMKANQTPVDGGKTISGLVAMMAELDQQISDATYFASRCPALKQADIDNAERIMGLEANPTNSMAYRSHTINGVMTVDEHKAEQAEIAQLKSVKVKLQKGIDRINSTLTIEIGEENAALLEGIGLL